jgi:hypothetical protein
MESSAIEISRGPLSAVPYPQGSPSKGVRNRTDTMILSEGFTLPRDEDIELYQAEAEDLERQFERTTAEEEEDSHSALIYENDKSDEVDDPHLDIVSQVTLPPSSEEKQDHPETVDPRVALLAEPYIAEEQPSELEAVEDDSEPVPIQEISQSEKVELATPSMEGEGNSAPIDDSVSPSDDSAIDTKSEPGPTAATVHEQSHTDQSKPSIAQEEAELEGVKAVSPEPEPAPVDEKREKSPEL